MLRRCRWIIVTGAMGALFFSAARSDAAQTEPFIGPPVDAPFEGNGAVRGPEVDAPEGNIKTEPTRDPVHGVVSALLSHKEYKDFTVAEREAIAVLFRADFQPPRGSKVEVTAHVGSKGINHRTVDGALSRAIGGMLRGENLAVVTHKVKGTISVAGGKPIAIDAHLTHRVTSPSTKTFTRLIHIAGMLKTTMGKGSIGLLGPIDARLGTIHKSGLRAVFGLSRGGGARSKHSLSELSHSCSGRIQIKRH